MFSFAWVVDEVAPHLRDDPHGVWSQAIQAARTLLEAAATGVADDAGAPWRGRWS